MQKTHFIYVSDCICHRTQRPETCWTNSCNANFLVQRVAELDQSFHVKETFFTEPTVALFAHFLVSAYGSVNFPDNKTFVELRMSDFKDFVRSDPLCAPVALIVVKLTKPPEVHSAGLTLICKG